MIEHPTEPDTPDVPSFEFQITNRLSLPKYLPGDILWRWDYLVPALVGVLTPIRKFETQFDDPTEIIVGDWMYEVIDLNGRSAGHSVVQEYGAVKAEDLYPVMDERMKVRPGTRMAASYEYWDAWLHREFCGKRFYVDGSRERWYCPGIAGNGALVLNKGDQQVFRAFSDVTIAFYPEHDKFYRVGEVVGQLIGVSDDDDQAYLDIGTSKEYIATIDELHECQRPEGWHPGILMKDRIPF